MNAFDILYNYQKSQNKEFKTNTPEILGLQATTSCYNHCKNCCSSCKPNGQELNIELMLKLFPNIENICLTGGEPFLNKKFGYFVDEFTKRGDAYINVMTAGINPFAPKGIIKQYYDNLELLCKTQKGLICFSYGEGVEPKKRFEEFLTKKKEFDMKYGYSWFQINVLGKDKEKEACDMIDKILGKEYDKRVSTTEIIKKDTNNNVISDKKCDMNTNELTINAKGELKICCSIPSELNPLTPYANIFEHSIKEILERQQYYKELLIEFQKGKLEMYDYKKIKNMDSESYIRYIKETIKSGKGDTCKKCVNKNGFNDFLEEKAKIVNQNI